MKTSESLTKKAPLLLGCLFLTSLSVLADDIQEALNLDYFRTPEASAFKKYGEESVNEYTGTVDISVPLYTIKCKDIEIPLMLRYDASGIKVEQEASWVGLGWNLMVGGCINYVCAGSHDRYTQCSIGNQTWTEYLTTAHTFADGMQYFHYAQDFNKEGKSWMEYVPHSFAFDPPYSENLSQDMQNYLMWGYGERDFYSVNVLGKSFHFFIDPATLKPYIIGEGGEDFKIEPYYKVEETTGIGNQPDVHEWTITDSNGYVYHFGNGDTLFDDKGWSYTSSWYLTKIQTPLGETVELSYTTPKEWSRSRRTESYTHLANTVSPGDECYCPKGKSVTYDNVRVKNTYVKEIKAGNQTVTFTLSDSKECSGKKLDAIKVKASDGTVTKRIIFSFSSFGCSNIGGNYAPASDPTAELRLKLDNIKEIASPDTLTTRFYYNSLNLPSKQSCAQDYWGYFNGQNNPSTKDVGYNGHTLLPTPTRFMTHNKNCISELENIKGANRYCNEQHMQAAILNKVVYPTGGYTIYEYEANRIPVNDIEETQKYLELTGNQGYDKYEASFSFSNIPSGPTLSLSPQEFELNEDRTFDVYLRCSSSENINGADMMIRLLALSPETSGKEIPVKFQSSTDFCFIQSLSLPAGKYRLMVMPPSVSIVGFGATCQLRWLDMDKYVESDFYVLCGGLRVKAISNYDHDGKITNHTTYDYKNSGLLLNSIETIEPFSYTYIEHNPIDGLNAPYMEESPFYNSRHYLSGSIVTMGQTLFPAFFASCNPGNVGYSQVTKCEYDANGHPERSVVTSYINHRPESMGVMDYYTRFDNGKILWQKTCDANGNDIKKVENEYRFHDFEDSDEEDKWYSTNMVARDKIRIDPNVLYIDETELNSRFLIWKYPYILSRVELSKTTSTEYCQDGGTIVKTKEYSYNTTNHQVSQIDENTSQPNQIRRTRITYSADGTDYVSRAMKNAHRLNDVVENKTILVENGQETKRISTQHTSYVDSLVGGTHYYLPSSLSTSIGDAALETRSRYSYDDSLNVRSIAVDGMETVYIWSYKGLYPIAKIEGLTFEKVKSAIGQTTMFNLLRKAKPSETDLSSIRNAITNAGGHITTYTYKPLVGIASETQPNGNTLYYEYDGFGRLTKVIDHNGSVISTNSYHYKK